MKSRKKPNSFEEAEIISHVVRLINPVEVLYHLLEVVESGDYQTGDWWEVEYDCLTQNYVERACPMTRVEWIYLKRRFDTEELDGKIYWSDSYNFGRAEDERFPSPWEVAKAMFDYRFISQFITLIDTENRCGAVSLIKQEIARIQIGKRKVIRGLYKCFVK